MNKKTMLLVGILSCLKLSSVCAFQSLGEPTCEEWKKARISTNYGKNLNADFNNLLAEISYEFFSMGYINAYATHFALSQNLDILKGKTKEMVLSLLDEQCDKKLEQGLGTALFAVSLKLVTLK